MTADTEHAPVEYDAARTDAGTWADTGTGLEWLRREFPHWGIMRPSPGGLWLAVCGKDITLRAPTPSELRDKIRDAGGDSRAAPA